jgi:ribokinase
MNPDKPHILVVGSLNIDRLATVERLPDPGETVPALSLIEAFGGKGANQALAAARQECSVVMAGCVGDDAAGTAYREHLRSQGIEDAGVCTIPGTLTGTAMIAVDEGGENQIIVCPGANGAMTGAHLQESLVTAAQVILLQWEVPQAVVLRTLELAEFHRVPVVLNPSPLRRGFPWGTHPIHTLIVNRVEAAAVFGQGAVEDVHALQAAMAMHRISRLVITRGADSTLGILPSSDLTVATLGVDPVDTVGAGDAFAGTYAACLARGMDFADSLRHANAAGALATLRPGAQAAIPHRPETEQALARIPPTASAAPT